MSAPTVQPLVLRGLPVPTANGTTYQPTAFGLVAVPTAPTEPTDQPEVEP